MTDHATPDCVCVSKEPHFCPPSFGDPGFYACEPEDVIAKVRELRAEIAKMKIDEDVYRLRRCAGCKSTNVKVAGMGYVRCQDCGKVCN